MMKWSNLKCDQCPKCGEPIKGNGGLLDMSYICSSQSYDFIIGEAKYEEIVGDRFRQTKRREQYIDHLSELNNLGREKVTEDFSDSPSLNK